MQIWIWTAKRVLSLELQMKQGNVWSDYMRRESKSVSLKKICHTSRTKYHLCFSIYNLKSLHFTDLQYNTGSTEKALLFLSIFQISVPFCTNILSLFSLQNFQNVVNTNHNDKFTKESMVNISFIIFRSDFIGSKIWKINFGESGKEIEVKIKIFHSVGEFF